MKNFKYGKGLISLGVFSGLGWLGFDNWEGLSGVLGQENIIAILSFLGAGLLGGGGYSWARRVKTTGRVELNDYFTSPGYTYLPKGRRGYSDRLAYTLSELADLAYWDVFTNEDLSNLEVVAQTDFENKNSFIVKLAKQLLYSRQQTTKDIFDEVLARGRFKSIAHISNDSNQCFVCVHEGNEDDAEFSEHEPYIVVAFRGSESDIDDWLTNGDATPASEFESGLVHQGFYKGYKSLQSKVLEKVEEAKQACGVDAPVFFTGHSLGGALALVATRLNAPNRPGGCYTFGSPRVGDYSFFKGVKTPVYRVVNSSDMVPRVPPDIWSHSIILLLKALEFLSARWKSLSGLFVAVQGWVDKINDYRHHGDLRYLPDIPSASITDGSRTQRELQILTNPNHFDVIQWFFRHLRSGLGIPVKSHSMKLYRNKLLTVAKTRMEKFELSEKYI